MKETSLLKKGLEIIVYVTLVINITTILLSIIVDVGITEISNIAGIMLFVALCINLSIIFFNFATLNREDANGKKLKGLCYIFLVFFFFAFSLMFYKQIIYLIEMDVGSVRYFIAEIVHAVGNFGILGFGLILALVDLKFLNLPTTWVQ